jgi:hypothetical protein
VRVLEPDWKSSQADAGTAGVVCSRSAQLLTVLSSPWLLAGIVAAGLVLRIAQYLSNRSLWTD